MANVANVEIDVGMQIRWTQRVTVYLRREIVEHAHAIASPQQLVREMRADESCTSRDEDGLHATANMQAQSR